MTTSNTDNPYRFVIAGLCLWAHFASGVSFQVVSPVLPLITEHYSVSHTVASLLVGAVLITSAVFGLPGAFIVGRLGVRRTYTLGWFLMGLKTLAAVSPGFAGLLAIRIGFGLGMVAIMTATGPLIMQWFRPKELPMITSLNIALMTIGMVISAAATAPLADALGWQRALGVFGAVGLAGAFAWLIWGRVQETAESKPSLLTWKDLSAVLKNRTILLLGVADASCFSMYIAVSSWLPTFYEETRGMSLTEAGFIVSLLPFMGIFAVVLGGFLPMKIGEKRLFFIVPGAMAALGGLGAFLIDNTAITYVSVMVLGMGAWMYVPMLLTLPMGLSGMTPLRIALAWGWISTASGLAGFASPLIVGAMRDTMNSFVPGFLVFSILAWFLVVAGFLMPKTAAQRSESRLPAESTGTNLE